MKNKRKRILIITIAILVFLVVFYKFGIFFIPALNANIFRMTISEIPQNLNVGDEITITARLQNRSLRFFDIEYTAAPTGSSLFKKSEDSGWIFKWESHLLITVQDFQSMPPFRYITYKLTHTFRESGEYVIVISTRIIVHHAMFRRSSLTFNYEYTHRVYITVD